MTIEPHTKTLIRHATGNFLVVLVFCVLAIALDWLEHWCAKHEVSSWLVTGIGAIAKVTFIFDGMLFLATLGLTSAHFVRDYYHRLFDR